jgi:hypothetical protein
MFRRSQAVRVGDARRRLASLSSDTARLTWGEVPSLDQPPDGVDEGLPQRARLQLQLVAGLGVIAVGIAVENPDTLGAPGQSRLQQALRDVCRPAEPGHKPCRERQEREATTTQIAECSWAAVRRRVLHDPPTERNRVRQTDFSELETPAGGIWRICAVIDYATKYRLAATITATARGGECGSRQAEAALPEHRPSTPGRDVCALTRGGSDQHTGPHRQPVRQQGEAVGISVCYAAPSSLNRPVLGRHVGRATS